MTEIPDHLKRFRKTLKQQLKEDLRANIPIGKVAEKHGIPVRDVFEILFEYSKDPEFSEKDLEGENEATSTEPATNFRRRVLLCESVSIIKGDTVQVTLVNRLGRISDLLFTSLVYYCNMMEAPRVGQMVTLDYFVNIDNS